MKQSLSTRLIVALETTAIIVLAVVIVIYAQVLWQTMQNPVAAPQAEYVDVDTTVDVVTPEERIRVLEELRGEVSSEVTLDERAEVLESLSSEEAPAPITEADRLEVLNSLRGGM